jgi:branched-chain amino acid transport system permease protein
MESDNRDVLYCQLFRKKQREYLRTVISEEIIEEHRRSPLGRHSEPLERLLHYLRSAPQRGKYVVKKDEKSRKFQIAQLSGERATPLREVSEAKYDTALEAYHEIFLRRVREVMESDT